MQFIPRLKSAARILLKGEAASHKRSEIPAITAEEVAEIRQFFAREKFFIMGHARSGTTILMRLARLHPEVHCNYQAHFFTRAPMLKSLVTAPKPQTGFRANPTAGTRAATCRRWSCAPPPTS